MANALRISGEADVLALGTRSGTYPVTMLCWARVVNDRNTYSAILTLEAGPGHSVEWNELVTDSDGTTLVVCDHGSLWATVGTMVVGTWHKVAMVITSGHVAAYFGTEGTPGVVQTVNATIANVSAVDYQGVGASNFAYSEWFDGRMSGVRVWNAELSEAEIEAEFQSATPVRTSGLLGAWLPPTVEIATVLDAITGDDLIDGAGGGTPHYTIEDAPTLDPAPTPSVIVLHSSWPGNTVCLSTATPTGAAASVDPEASVASGWVACSAAATGEQAGAEVAAGTVLASQAAAGSSSGGEAATGTAAASQVATGWQTDGSTASGTAAASGPAVSSSSETGAVAGLTLASAAATSTQGEGSAASGYVRASASCVASEGHPGAASGLVVVSGTAVSSEAGYSCARTPETLIVSGRIVDLCWDASCAQGLVVATGAAVGESSDSDALSQPVVGVVRVARAMGRLVPLTAAAQGRSLARVRAQGRLVPLVVQARGEVA